MILIILRTVPRTIHKPLMLTGPMNQKFMFMVGPCPSLVYTLSMASVFKKTRKTRCRVFLQVVIASTGLLYDHTFSVCRDALLNRSFLVEFPRFVLQYTPELVPMLM